MVTLDVVGAVVVVVDARPLTSETGRGGAAGAAAGTEGDDAGGALTTAVPLWHIETPKIKTKGKTANRNSIT